MPCAAPTRTLQGAMDAQYISEPNRDVAPARPGEFPPVRIGPLRVSPPVVLAPMAGITNAPFRTLCRRFGAGLYVSEMITARALVERNQKTLRLAGFDPDEPPRDSSETRCAARLEKRPGGRLPPDDRSVS